MTDERRGGRGRPPFLVRGSLSSWGRGEATRGPGLGERCFLRVHQSWASTLPSELEIGVSIPRQFHGMAGPARIPPVEEEIQNA